MKTMGCFARIPFNVNRTQTTVNFYSAQSPSRVIKL